MVAIKQDSPTKYQKHSHLTEKAKPGGGDKKGGMVFLVAMGIFLIGVLAVAAMATPKVSELALNPNEAEPNDENEAVSAIATSTPEPSKEPEETESGFSDLTVPTPTVTPEPTDTPVALLPDWYYQSTGACKATFGLPPQKTPYMHPYQESRSADITVNEGSGRYWDFPRGTSYPNMLSKFTNGATTYQQVMTMYAAPEEASGYIDSAVVVSCIPNVNGYSNAQMLAVLQQKLNQYNNSSEYKGVQPQSYTITQALKYEKWGREVIDLAVSEQTQSDNPTIVIAGYTLFATDDYIYEVRKMGASKDAFVKETTQGIFDALKFE